MTTNSTELRPRRISARLDVENKTRNDLLLDLWQGFSKKIFVRTESDEEQDVSYYIPVFYNAPWSDYCADVELGRALQVGLLEFATEEGETVPIDTDTLHVAEIDRRIHLCEAYVGRCYPLARTSSNLLGRLRRSLNPEKTYLLRFGTNPLKIWWEFATSESIHKPLLSPSQWSADQWPKDKQITMAYDPMPILFSVITGISIPRFTIEFSISASVCDVDEYRQFFATLKVASLEDKPVIVHRWLDNFMDLWQDERGSRGNEMDCLDVFDLCDETSLDSTTLPGDTPRPDINDPIRPEDICLHKGDTYTRNVYFDQGDLARLIPERTYSMTM